MNGAAAAKGPGSQVQMISDNDLFKPAASKAKTSLRLGMGQPKKVRCLILLVLCLTLLC